MKFITGNINKFSEIQKLVPAIEQLSIDLDEIQEFDAQKVIEHKIIQAKEQCSGDFFIEDTSLYIDALQGFPGPFIKWFLQSLKPQGIYELVQKYETPTATAQTIIGAYIHGETYFFIGQTKGTIVSPKSTSFGWDGIFQPEGFTKRYSELSVEEKNAISQRMKAVEKFKEFLEKSQQ